MSVTNGQTANQTTFNNGFMSRNSDSDTTGVQTFNNTSDPNSGSQIINIQRAVNETFDAVGMTGEGDATRKNYSTNNYITNGDSHKTAIGKLDAELAVLAALITTSSWTTHNVTDGQSATALSGESADGTVYTSVVFEFEAIRGTTVIANGRLSMQYANGTWRVNAGSYEGDAHGITWTVSQISNTGTLNAALDSGAGDGTIKISKKLVPA